MFVLLRYLTDQYMNVITNAKKRALKLDIVEEAKVTWPLLHVLLVHRVGTIRPSDPIVLVAVWSAHRAAAFDACRFLMEALKHKAPFWKKESLVSGDARWVSENTLGTS